MAYTTINDIQYFFQDYTFSSNTVVTSDAVQFFIDNWGVYINSKLNSYYVLPITDIEDLKILKIINSKYAANEVDQILLNKSNEVSGRELLRVRNLKKEADELLNKIIGEEGFTFATIKLNSSYRGNLEYQKIDECGNELEPYFKRETIY